MCPTVFLQDFVAEVLHAQTQTRDAQLAQRMDFGFRQGSGFTFESDLFRLIPVDVCRRRSNERFQLFRAGEGRRAATEIDEPKGASAHAR